MASFLDQGPEPRGGVGSLISRLVEFGATPEQVEHELREAGLRDADEPSLAPYKYVRGEIISTREEPATARECGNDSHHGYGTGYCGDCTKEAGHA